MDGRNGSATQEILLTVVGDRPDQPVPPRIAIVVDGALVATEPPLSGLQQRGWLAHRWEGGTLLAYLNPTFWEELQTLGEAAQTVAAAIAPWQREPVLVFWDGESQFTSERAAVTVAGGPYLQRVQAWAQTLPPTTTVVVVLHRAPPDLPLVLAPPAPRWRLGWGRPMLSRRWVLLSPDRALGDRLRSLGWQTFTDGTALQQYLETQVRPSGLPVSIVDDRGQEVARWHGHLPARFRFALPATSAWFELVWRPARAVPWWSLPLAAIAGLGVGWIWGHTLVPPPVVLPVPPAPTLRRATLTVYFPPNSTLLTPLQRQRLQDFWATYQAKAGDLQVVGHADDGVSPTHHQSLSEQRAWAVIAFLRQNLGDRHRLRIGYRGTDQPVHKDPAFNRRVELTFHYRPGN
ncbi:MAG: OmpA family protein [Pseudanabaenaceae cyanobacterium]